MNERQNIREQLPKLVLDRNRFRVKRCPCGKENKDGKFVPFVGYEKKGYCHSCGVTFLPELHKSEQRRAHVNHSELYSKTKFEVSPKQSPISYISVEVFNKSLNCPQENNFVSFLFQKFGAAITKQLMETYFIDSSKHWPGATLFWQIDIKGKIRTGKIMLYDPTTVKRITSHSRASLNASDHKAEMSATVRIGAK